ncbi:MAG TPA: arginine kinase [Desulfocapsa sulfexigens]|nr:arginine kinase [Desulfocapsa sulfexigens]
MSDKSKPDPFYDLIMDDDLARNQWPGKIDQLKKDGKHLSLMAQAMNKEKFEALKNHKTRTAGWTIARAINTGTLYPSSSVGCHAGDHESYSDFKVLFQPVIESYHSGYSLDKDKHVTDLDVTNIKTDLSEQARNKVISTRIRVARNLDFFPLNPGGTQQSRLEIIKLVETAVQTLEGDLKGEFYRHTTMTPDQTQNLIDEHFLFKGKDKMQAASGHHEYWPIGRGIYLSKSKEFILWVNEGDHLRIISMEQGGDVKGVFERLGRGIDAIENGLKKITRRDSIFMFDDVLGMITCCPSNLGTAMRASVHMRIPKLISKMGLEGIDSIARESYCQARGGSGEHSEVIDRVDISNWRRLGVKEYELVEDMINCVNKLAIMEDEIVS